MSKTFFTKAKIYILVVTVNKSKIVYGYTQPKSLLTYLQNCQNTASKNHKIIKSYTPKPS